MRQTEMFCVLMLSLGLNLLLAGATKEDVEERFASLKGGETGEDDEITLLAANEIDSDLSFRPEDIPIVCRLIFAGALQSQSTGKRSTQFHPWKGKRYTGEPSFSRQQQLMMDSLVKKGGFNPWGGKRQIVSDSGNENRIVTKNDGTGKVSRSSFNPWGGR